MWFGDRIPAVVNPDAIAIEKGEETVTGRQLLRLARRSHERVRGLEGKAEICA